jgi:hypothetical protein
MSRGRCAVPAERKVLSGAHAFGLPRNAYYKDEDRTLQVGVGPELNGRRASPLFISVVRDGGAFRPIFLLLPARFLPRCKDYKPHVGLSESDELAALKPPDYSTATAFFKGSDYPSWQGLLTGKRWSGNQLDIW